MTSNEICDELIRLSDEQLDAIEKILPTEPVLSLLLFTEMLRVLDYAGTAKENFDSAKGITFQDIEIMGMGWNLAAFYLLKKIESPGFPLKESSRSTQNHAASLLMGLGATTLVKRAVDMVRTSLMSVEKTDNIVTFRKTDTTNSQFPDMMEFSYLDTLENQIENSGDTFGNWNLINRDNISQTFDRPGNFLSKKKDAFLESNIMPDIESKLRTMVCPWDSGRGIMIEYGSTIEIDNHFLANAIKLVNFWRNQAGLHPDLKINNITGAELTAVVLYIVSLHLKHTHCVQIAYSKHPQISIPQSLTIWEPLEKLINDISEFTGMDRKVILEVFEVIALKADDVRFLQNYTSKFMPLLIDIGNGFILRPISSIRINPFFTIIALLEHRDPGINNKISNPREGWLRNEIYSVFAGTRYQRVNGNIKLRQGSEIITDIDAAVFDILTGELALFQIKWQDFFFNDVKKLRSRASNLTAEFDSWAEKITSWIDKNGTVKLSQSLKIKPVKGKKVSSVYLFGLSRNKARMQGFGYSIKSEKLAIATWPQFIRVRTEIGPASNVFKEIFARLKEEESHIVLTKALETDVRIGDLTLRFEDLWSAADE